jgi:hypothetical protein
VPHITFGIFNLAIPNIIAWITVVVSFVAAVWGRLPYSLDFTRSLLYFQDDVYNNVAQKLDLTGTQWGISYETGNYPGSWWLWPYTFLYQIKPIASSANADLVVGVVMLVIFLIIMLMPFIPGLNRLPHWLKVYRLIWRDWYQRPGKS